MHNATNERNRLSITALISGSARKLRHFYQRERQRPSDISVRAVSSLLVVAILVQLAAVPLPLVHAADGDTAGGGSVAISAHNRQGAAPRLDVAAIVNAHLFGIVTDANAPLQKTDLPLILVATFATSDLARGMAVLKQDPVGPGRLYIVGAELPGGAGQLREVRNGSIVLDRAGQLETLAFIRSANALDLGGMGGATARAEVMLAQVAVGGAGLEPVTDAVLQQRAEAAGQGEQIDTAVPGALPREVTNPTP